MGYDTIPQPRIFPDVNFLDKGILASTQDEYKRAGINGDVFSWYVNGNLATDDTVVLITNNSEDKTLVVQNIRVYFPTAASVIDLHFPVYPTIVGTEMTGVSLGRAWDAIPNSDVYFDETGNSQANVIYTATIAQTTWTDLPTLLQGVIRLGYHNCFAMDAATAQTGADCFVLAYFI